MKTKNVIGAFAALLLAGTASAALAGSTTVTSTWTGSGNVTFDATAAGSTHSNVTTGGNGINGSASFVNQANNPYGYGVDSTVTSVQAAVTGGGFATSTVNRTGSYTPLYGASGQSITAYGSSSDGTVGVVQHANVNYASMNDIGYGNPHTAGGNTVDAAGTVYQVGYTVDTGVLGNSGGIQVNGSGSAGLLQASSGASGTGFNLGNGQGIYTQANLTATGVGNFAFGGSATKSLTVLGANNTLPGTVNNPATVTVLGTFDTTGGSAATWTNYAITGASNGPAVPPPVI